MTSTEATLARRLARMRWIATGLLLAMGVLFVVTGLILPTYPWLGVVHAFAEAGMIGALADWFAVTALFRHPLGLPIPHTAIVPSRKDEMGRALARFIRDHFLVRETVEARLEQVDLSGRVGQWLAVEENNQRIAGDLCVGLEWLLIALDSPELRGSLRESLKRALDEAPVNSVLAVAMDVFTTGDHGRALVDQLVQFGRDQLDANRERIRTRIADRSPWWLPKFVDEEIYDQLVAELSRILDEVGDDPNHPAREGFNDRLRGLKDALADDPVLIERGRYIKDEFIGHPAVNEYFQDLWQTISEYLRGELRDPASSIRAGIARELGSIAIALRDDPDLNERLNR